MQLLPYFSSLTSQIKTSIKKRPMLFFCLFLVFILHISFILCFYADPKPKLNHKQKKLVVKTHLLPQTYLASTKPSIKTSTPQNNSKKSSALSHKKAATTKKESHAVKPSKSKEVLKHLQESLAKIETTKEITRHKESMLVPQSIKELKADSYQINSEMLIEQEQAYQDLLVSFLKQTLQLPAYGSVKLSLTIEKNGKLEELKILFSDSEINRLYLEEELKHLHYPSFREELSGETKHTFKLTFCSEQ